MTTATLTDQRVRCGQCGKMLAVVTVAPPGTTIEILCARCKTLTQWVAP